MAVTAPPVHHLQPHSRRRISLMTLFQTLVLGVSAFVIYSSLFDPTWVSTHRTSSSSAQFRRRAEARRGIRSASSSSSSSSSPSSGKRKVDVVNGPTTVGAGGEEGRELAKELDVLRHCFCGGTSARKVDPPLWRYRLSKKQLAKLSGSGGGQHTLPSPSIRIACVGDSITYGNGTHVGKREREHEGNYPLTLAQRLLYRRGRSSSPTQRDPRVVMVYESGGSMADQQQQLPPPQEVRCSDVQLVVKNFGHSGRTAATVPAKFSYRRSSFYNASTNFNGDIVVMMLGTNDAKPRTWKNASSYEQDLLWFVDAYRRRLRASSQQRQSSSTRSTMASVFLMAPPPAFTAKGTINGSRIHSDVSPSVRKLAAERATSKVSGLVDLELEFWKQLSADAVVGRAAQAGAEGKNMVRFPSSSSSNGLPLVSKEEWQRWFHDGVHPTMLGHDLIAEAVERELCVF